MHTLFNNNMLNKVCIILITFKLSTRQARGDAQSAPAYPIVGIIDLPSEGPGSGPQVCLHFLPVQEHVVPPHDSRSCQANVIKYFNFFSLLFTKKPWGTVTLLLLLPLPAVTGLPHLPTPAGILLPHFHAGISDF